MSQVTGHTLSTVSIGADPKPMDGDTGWITATTALSAAHDYAALGALPATNAANGVFWYPSKSKANIGLRFVGAHATGAVGVAFTARLWGIAGRMRPDINLPEFHGVQLLDLTLTTNAAAAPFSGSTTLNLSRGAGFVTCLVDRALVTDWTGGGTKFIGNPNYATATAASWLEIVVPTNAHLGFVLELRAAATLSDVRAMIREL